MLSFATKLIEKTPHPSNNKEYSQSYLKKKKLVKRSKIIAQQSITRENSKHPKTSHKLSETIKQAI